MKNGYKIYWTDHALKELKATYQYLEKHWTEKEMRALSIELERTIQLISNNPKLFPLYNEKKVRRVSVKKYNTIYYKELKDSKIEILSFFSNRQDPKKKEL